MQREGQHRHGCGDVCDARFGCAPRGGSYPAIVVVVIAAAVVVRSLVGGGVGVVSIFVRVCQPAILIIVIRYFVDVDDGCVCGDRGQARAGCVATLRAGLDGCDVSGDLK